MTTEEPLSAMEEFITSIAQSHDDLPARLRILTHSAKSKDERVKLHAHFLAFRDGHPTVDEFVRLLHHKLVPFCLHRKHINRIQETWASLPPHKIQESAVQLQNLAIDLFKKANKKTNRNGEFGELIVYLLIETILKAPQFVAKMSLKTNSQMPVHGSDGIHLRLDAASGKLSLYWGESKCYASVEAAIERAAQSIAENLEHEKMAQELFLIEQYFDLTGFPDTFRESILSFLNPYDENYNKRSDISVMLIAFDFEGFAAVNKLKTEQVEPAFSNQLRVAVEQYAGRVDKALDKHSVRKHSIEVFFLPVPSVAAMRTLFQDGIGWS